MEFKMEYCPFCGNNEFVFTETEVACRSCGHSHDIKDGKVDYDYETVEIYCKDAGITIEAFFGTDKEVWNNSQSELLVVEINDSNEPTVSGRLLHEFLKIDSNYTTWFNRMCEYGFTEEVDYITRWHDSKNEIVKFNGNIQSMTRNGYTLNHEMKIDMAKEISMIQRNERGKQARQYFIAVEKDWNSPEKTMARALLMADKKIKQLSVVNEQQSKKIEIDKPKVLFADSVAVSKGTMLIGELAKIITQNGYETGEKRLYAWLRDNGYLIKRKGKDHNKPTQRSSEMGLFEISETTINHNSGIITTKTTTRVTGKGQIYFVNKFKEMLSKAKADLIDFADAKALKEGIAQ